MQHWIKLPLLDRILKQEKAHPDRGIPTAAADPGWYGFSGVRPSSGAASCYRRMRCKILCPPARSPLSAPEDGRTPLTHTRLIGRAANRGSSGTAALRAIHGPAPLRSLLV